MINNSETDIDLNLELITTQPKSPRPRRTLNRLALALIGVAAAASGQYFFSQESLWDGLLLYGVGIILFAAALAERLTPVPPARPTPWARDFRSGWWRTIGIWLIIFTAGLSFVTYNFFGNEDGLLQAWWLYTTALILFIAGGLLLTRGALWSAGVKLDVKDYVLMSLVIIVALALFMRLFRFDSQPVGIWFDEAEAGLQARRMLQEPTYRPVLFAPINITGHLLGLYALALHWLGDNIQSMRLVSVAFGVGAVLAAYLFGREVRSVRFGLALAFLVAVARWHVNFSRIAMTGIDAPFFEFLSLFFLTRWVRRRRLRDAMWAGLTLGLGLMFYTAFRLYIAALVIFTILAFMLWWRRVLKLVLQTGWQTILGHFTVLLIAGWLVVLPLVQFSQNNPQAFWYRTQQISIFTKRDQADIRTALWETTQKHLLMFNFAGDKNGRHNLPGEPMLDPAMGVFWLLGAGLAIARLLQRRATQPLDLFFILLFFLALVGGIFSVDFEAPQSLRSIAVIPAIIYFCGLAIAALGRELERAFAPLPKLWVASPVVIVAGFILYANATTYFVEQGNDFASWNAFSTPETVVGRRMAELGPDYQFLLSPFFSNHPSIGFLAPEGIHQQRPLILPDALPIRQAAERPVALFIHPDDVAVFKQTQILYPTGQFEIANSQSVDERPIVYLVDLQPADIAALQGLDLTYFPTNAAEDEGVLPLQTLRVENINAIWPQDGPPAADFVAEWEGILYAAQYGAYGLRLVTPGPANLEIDGKLILEGEGEQQTRLLLAQGNHTIHLRVENGPGQVVLFWQPPGGGELVVPTSAFYVPPITNNGLQGIFYANDRWANEPILQRIDPSLDTYFHLIPLPRPYTVEWAGWLDVPQAGLYRLGLRAVQEATLSINGLQVVATQTPNQYIDAEVTLQAGLNEILVRFKDTVDRSRIHLYWTKPDGVSEPIPTQNLWPASAKPSESRAAQARPSAETQPLQLRWVQTIGGQGSQPGQFLEPRDVAVLPNGNMVVADTANRRVQILDAQGNFIQTLTGDDLPFEEPLAVGVNTLGQILALDSTLQWIYRYDLAGNLMDRFGGPEARLFHPRGLTVLPDDSVAVADTGTGSIKFFNPDGRLRGQIGQVGSSPGQFSEPTDILQDDQATLLVAEADTNRIQQVDIGGRPLSQWTIPTTYAFNGPHLALGPDGSIFMTEVQSQSLSRYAPDGNLLDQWQFIDTVALVGPVGLYFDPATSWLYVTDVSTHQIHIFEVFIQ